MANRDKFPEIVNQKAKIDLDSQKFLKLWHGPQHPGVTGNMSLELVVSGDEVMELKTHVGYLHRGFEKLMERRSFLQSFTIVCRICVPEPDTNEYLYSSAIEELAGIEIPEKAKWLRTFDLELSRLASFLMWVGGQAGTFGLGPIGQWGVTHRDYILDLFEELTGARVYHMYMVPGGVRGDMPAGFAQRVEAVLKKCEKVIKEIEFVMTNNSVLKSRMVGLGVITKEMVDRFGVVGPNARAAGFARDVRKDNPYLIYDQLDFEVKTGLVSDAYDRMNIRFYEMYQSIDLLRQILSRMPKSGDVHVKTPNPLHWKIKPGQTYVRAESTRGEYGFFAVTDGSALPRKITVRGPSYTHAVSLLEYMATAVNIADIGGLMVSLHTYPPEIER